ncbi:MAG: endo-1,4-beta-xylanase [Phycisphaeraceae bacterium]|nr:endo-1,4-beta-xylanase [Phycisphaeraceae bacterium]
MTGPWVEQLNQRIDDIRKTDLRVIVLDAEGKPVSRAAVRIEQISHDFPLGFVLGEGGFDAVRDKLPALAVLNAVALDRLTAWSRLQQNPLAEPDYAAVDEAVREARQLGLHVRWGGLLSADAARNPDWLSLMDKPQMTAAIENHVIDVLQRYRGEVDAFDLYTHSLDHQWVTDQLGDAVIRRLYDQAHAIAPRAALALGLENCLTETRLRKAIEHCKDMRNRFVHFNQVAIEQRMGGVLLQRQLAHGLDLLGELGGDVVIGPLEVGGSSAPAAANNLETLLRILFACDCVRGIYFSGLTIDDVADPNATLIDNAGHLTEPGQLIAGLFGSEWWTNLTIATDEVGNAYARPFTGTHRITATLPDGSTLRTTVYLSKSAPPGLAQHIVLLEPDKP